YCLMICQCYVRFRSESPPLSESLAHAQYPSSFPTRRSSDLFVWFGPPAAAPQPGGNARRSRFVGRPGLAWDDRRSESGEHFLRRSEEHTSELQSRVDLVCRLLLAKKNVQAYYVIQTI